MLRFAIFWLGIFPLLSIAAYAQVPPSGTFTATRTCVAPRAINGINPGNIQVSKGQRYQAVGFNSPKRKFIQIAVPGAKPERRWVSADCGNFSPATDPISSSDSPVTQPLASVLPFFDNVNNPELHGFPRNQTADITPPLPQLSAFDQAVLRTCGPIGSKVTASDFKKLMSENREVLREIQQAVGGKLRAVRSTEAEFLDDLTVAWSGRGGFEHIFCGELEGPTKIGGMHFFGRYGQLQEQGIGGRLSNNLQKEEVVPGLVYTLGILIQKDGQSWKDDIKGYALVSDAKEILLDATKALKAQGNAQGACLLTVQDNETKKSYQAVFVKSQDAIVTFYPDATPRGKACRR
ncbi:EndoU domain-containing protein [Coleofasciculus sp. FACHB-1120]|uniref:EndoU domain-containing protein n=1 Tax=Coleofasciculus sp. FACHB-1120 TaxID=2692783 RepID=UPI0016862F37|nr:EndoU domain-containing protein [Coleofasciculus sp. FACHB-1120]MBD2744174.1 EndoU domain-containing protein [Coleofasciculus sp. FACHB-1120]